MSAPMLASDANNPNFVGAHNPDTALVVKFYSRPVEQPFLSKEQGRPIFQDVDYIQIFTPGNQLNIIDTAVRQDHKARFPQQWALYQNSKGAADQIIGTPVSAWPFLSASQAEEFKALKFFTVEQIAGASDLQLQTMGMTGGMNPHVIRDRAKAYLSAAAGTAPIEAQAQENAELKERIAAMEKQMQAMLAAGVAPVAAEPVPKRKRRTKAEMEAATQVLPGQVIAGQQPEAAEEAPI